MTFTSLNFLFFFPVVIVLFNLIPQRGRVWFLLIASYFFYINLLPFFAILLASLTGCAYLFTKRIAQSKSEIGKHRLLVWGIIVIISPLFFFKYFSFVNHVIVALLFRYGIHVSTPTSSLILPIGISFYTFMAIGYLIDVYNEDVEFESSIVKVGLFLAFFPIILSGPIERAGNILPQFKKLKKSTYNDLVGGAKMVLWGYFLKLCIADRLGLFVDLVFNNIHTYNGTTLLLASVLFPFQLYADLGGYSLIAIGVARCLGIIVIPNFKRPFFAISVSELWRRWHMSLIQWLTNYIYTPISFSLRKWKMRGIVTALMLTFIISGIWHGSALTFFVWGLIQGVYLSIEALTQEKRTKFKQKFCLSKKPWFILINCVWVFVLFSFSQIFARCDSLGDAIDVIGKILCEHGKIKGISLLIPGLFLLAHLLLKDFMDEYFPKRLLLFENKNIIVRYLSYAFILILILTMGVFDSGQFIYFQF